MEEKKSRKIAGSVCFKIEVKGNIFRLETRYNRQDLPLPAVPDIFCEMPCRPFERLMY
jgi:hypothetical protein